MGRLWRGRYAALSLCTVLAVLPGCASIGPGRMVQDRTDYNASLTESWKRQILLNIIKIRYVEPVFFMDVGDIVAGYTMETGGTAGFSRTVYDSPPVGDSPVFGNFGKLEFGVSGRYTDRPTITYKPMTGAPFRRGVMSALPLHNVLAGLDTGISAQFLFNLGVRSINGLRNAALSPTGSMPAQQEFKQMTVLLAQLQMAGALRARIEPLQQGHERKLFLSFGGKNPAPEIVSRIAELQRLLDLDPSVHEYAVISDPEVHNRRQIAIQTFSLLQIMAFVAARVDIPEKDIASQCAMPAMSEAPGEGVMRAVAVHSGSAKPQDVFASVQFHGHWFWVDDHDLATKRVFSFLMLVFTLMEDKTTPSPVQLTIPVQ